MVVIRLLLLLLEHSLLHQTLLFQPLLILQLLILLHSIHSGKVTFGIPALTRSKEYHGSDSKCQTTYKASVRKFQKKSEYRLSTTSTIFLSTTTTSNHGVSYYLHSKLPIPQLHTISIKPRYSAHQNIERRTCQIQHQNIANSHNVTVKSTHDRPVLTSQLMNTMSIQRIFKTSRFMSL